jgi:predicted MPP superfamily phosphohydrolase
MHNEIFYTNKNINETKIALLSDIHFNDKYNRKIFTKILKQISNNTPNYITIVGDILDTSNTTNLDDLKDFLEGLSKIATTLVVLGNHDEKAGEMHNWISEKNEKLIKILNNIDNVYLLNDKTYTNNNITFYGFHLSYDYYEVKHETYEAFENELKNIECNINKKDYNITLFHSPINIYKYINNNPNHNLNNSDLILSGHMHNGCLPFTISYIINKLFKSSRGFISPTRKLFPKYAQGRIYERDGYVYQGIMKLSHSTKLFNKLDFIFQKEVQFITIKPNKK